MFAQKSGVSLDGHVMLYTGDVQYNWLDVTIIFISHPIHTDTQMTDPKMFPPFQFIGNISKQDEYRKKVPSYELALSQVLRNIVVSRRKFMPKAQVVNYASHLRKLTTTMLDYQTMYSYPKSWPVNLECYEIVVES